MYNQFVVRKSGDKYLLVNICTNEIMEIDYIISRCILQVQNTDCFDSAKIAKENNMSIEEVEDLWSEIIIALGEE